jgi:hypothetical protein
MASSTIPLPAGAGLATKTTAGGSKTVFYPAADTPLPDAALFHVSPTALPGEPFLAIGHFSGVAKVYVQVQGVGSLIKCEVQVQGPKAAIALLPANLALSEYAVVVKDGSKATNSLPINRPRCRQMDWPAIVAGATFNAIGENLLFAGATPTAFLQNAVGERFACVVNVPASTSTRLSIAASTGLVPGAALSLLLSNGLGAEVVAEQTLNCLAPVTATLAGLDPRVAAGFPFLSTVYQSTDSLFTQQPAVNTATSSTQAINDSLVKVSNQGGGGYQLPAGVVRIGQQNDVHALTIPANVWLCGAGEDKTILEFGYGDQVGFGYGIFFGKNNVGLANLTLKNVNEKGSWNRNVLLNGGDSPLDNVTFFNVGMSLRGESVKTTSGVTRLHIDGGHYTSRALRPDNSLNEGAFTLHNCGNVWMRKVYTLHEVGQTSFKYSSNICIENPRFVRDAAINNVAPILEKDCRGGSADFVENLAMWGGSIDTINGPATDENASGETWLSEGGGTGRGESEWGTATSATATTLVDTRASFGVRDRHDVKAKPVVAIMSGRGAYQWRYCTITNGTTLTLETPWTIVPDATSTYSLTNWSAKNWTISDVAANNNRAGFVFFAASTLNVAVDGLTLNNNHAILIKPYQRALGTPGQQELGKDGACTPCWNIQLTNNTVSDTGNLIKYVPAFIGASPISTVKELTGGLAVGIELRDNRVNALAGFVPFPAVSGANNQFPYNDAIQRNGFYFRSEMQVFNDANQYASNLGVPMTFGCLGWNNSAKNCESAYTIDSGAVVTLLSPGKLVNTPALVSDALLGASAAGSKLTRALAPAAKPVAPPVKPPTTPTTPTTPATPTQPAGPSTYALSATRSYPEASSYTYEDSALVVRNSVPAFNTGASSYTISNRFFNKPGASNGWLADIYMPNGEQIIFDRCVFATSTNGDMAHITNDSRVRFRNCIFIGTGTQAPGVLRARAIFAERPRLVDAQNCYFLNTAGCKLNNWSTSGLTAADTVTWKYNRYDNIMGGTGSAYCQALQLQHIIRPGIEVAFNQIVNEPGKSRVEDNFNWGESGGTADSWMRVHHNCIRGAYQANPTDGSFTGTGWTSDAGSASVPASLQPQYILSENNYIIGTMNAAMNIAAGHHIVYRKNKVVISGFLPDGKTKISGIYTAVSIFRGQPYSTEQFNYNEITENDIFVNTANGKGFFFENSTDPNVVPLKRYAGPNSKPLLAGNTLNTYRDGATYADEVKLFDEWKGYLSDNKIYLGVPLAS